MRMRALGALLTAATAVTLTGPAGPAQARPAEGRVLGVGLAGTIPGRYVVTLKDGSTAMSALSLGAGIAKRSGRTFAASMTAVQARRLAADPSVRFVEQDRIMHVEATQRKPDWGLDRIDQRSVTPSRTYTPTDDGDSVHAYVIDTGIRITHTEFAGRASYGYDFVDGDTTASDCNGHGTHVAGTIGGTHYGVAKKVKLVAVRVLDCAGDGDLYDVIAGVNWVTSHAVRPAVANMSMGGGPSPSLDAAIQQSIGAGITYVVAAGNENTNAAGGSPAGLAAAITVGATDSRDRRADFSNYGSVVDIFAPGVDIRSSVSASNTATDVYSGTSMAAPHVAGAAALVLDADPGYSPARVRDYLVARSTKGRVRDPHGSPNRLLYIPQPPKAPVIATSRVTASLLRSYSGRLTLAAARRGSWSVARGSLPAGLRLTADGVVSGTPTTPGTSTATVRFVDFVPHTVTRTVTFTVTATDPVIATDSLPAASAGVEYTQQLAVSDGRDGTWSVVDGSLPDGLTLSPEGLLDGTPTATGTFTVEFTDQWGGTATATYTLTVDPQS